MNVHNDVQSDNTLPATVASFCVAEAYQTVLVGTFPCTLSSHNQTPTSFFFFVFTKPRSRIIINGSISCLLFVVIGHFDSPCRIFIVNVTSWTEKRLFLFYKLRPNTIMDAYLILVWNDLWEEFSNCGCFQRHDPSSNTRMCLYVSQLSLCLLSLFTGSRPISANSVINPVFNQYDSEPILIEGVRCSLHAVTFVGLFDALYRIKVTIWIYRNYISTGLHLHTDRYRRKWISEHRIWIQQHRK